jgi:hypothetical protein
MSKRKYQLTIFFTDNRYLGNDNKNNVFVKLNPSCVIFNWYGQVRSGQVKLGPVRSCQVRYFNYWFLLCLYIYVYKTYWEWCIGRLESLAEALGGTKFITLIVITLVTLCCAPQVWLKWLCSGNTVVEHTTRFYKI